MKFKFLTYLSCIVFVSSRRLLSQEEETETSLTEAENCLVEAGNEVYQLRRAEKNFKFAFTVNDTIEFNVCETLKNNNKTAPTFAMRCGPSSCIALTNDDF